MTITYGENKLGAYALFVQRRLYKDFAYPIEDMNVKVPFDLWFEKPLYARIDPNENPIYPVEDKLKVLESAPDKNLFVLNFVADAFENFRRYYLLLNKEDATGSAFEFMVPHAAYQNPLKLREEFMDKLYNLFVTSYLPLEKRYERITSFKSFLKQFKKFMSETNGDIPITLSSFMVSSYLSPMSSGVMIEIADSPYGGDEEKCTEFLQNVCFPCYTQAAQKFGFKVDKNVPWRLIADLKSPCMVKYMSKYQWTRSIPSNKRGPAPRIWISAEGKAIDESRKAAKAGIPFDTSRKYKGYWATLSPTQTEWVPFTFNTMFKYYYNKSYLRDVSFIKDILARFYYSYISANPVFTRYSFSKKCGGFKKEVVKRERISKEIINREFPDSFWLGYYAQTLSYETHTKKTSKELQNIVAKGQTKLRQQNMESAVKYVFDSFKENLLTVT